MKRIIKHISLLLCCIALSTEFFVVVSAHPGKTDSSGGHYDHSTGEYHYHHGYSAHSHYDVDGDGVMDCPYNFDDQTGINSGSPSSRGTYSRNYSSYDYDPPETITVYKDREVIKEVQVTPTWTKWSLGLSVVWILYLLASNRWKKDDIANLERSVRCLNQEAQEKDQFHKAEMQRLFEIYKEKFFQLGKTHKEEIQKIVYDKDTAINTLQYENTSLRKELHSVISSIPVGEAYYPEPSNPELALHRIEIPKDVYFIDGNIPVKGVVTSYDPFGDFTVFTLKNSAIYHSNKYCSGTFNMEPVHLFDVISRKRPCLRCGKDHGAAPPEWYTELIALQKYCK